MSKQESGWTNRPTLDIDEPEGTTILQATNAANTMKRSGKRQYVVYHSDLAPTIERFPLWKFAAKKGLPPSSKAQQTTRVSPATRSTARTKMKWYQKHILRKITGSTKNCHAKEKDEMRKRRSPSESKRKRVSKNRITRLHPRKPLYHAHLARRTLETRQLRPYRHRHCR